MESIVQHAIQYGEILGWKTIPVNQNKVPLCKHGVKDAVSNAQGIGVLFDQTPKATGIGVATGKEAGFFVVDIDGKTGIESLSNIECKYKVLPETVTQKTGGGGYHYFFRYPEGSTIKSSICKIGEKIDIKSDGGYVVVAPSYHKTGSIYEWLPGSSPYDREIAEAPDWFVNVILQLQQKNLGDQMKQTCNDGNTETDPKIRTVA